MYACGLYVCPCMHAQRQNIDLGVRTASTVYCCYAAADASIHGPQRTEQSSEERLWE